MKVPRVFVIRWISYSGWRPQPQISLGKSWVMARNECMGLGGMNSRLGSSGSESGRADRSVLETSPWIAPSDGGRTMLTSSRLGCATGRRQPSGPAEHISRSCQQDSTHHMWAVVLVPWHDWFHDR